MRNFIAKHSQCIARLLCIPTAGIDDSLYTDRARKSHPLRACTYALTYSSSLYQSMHPPKISPPGPITGPDWRAVSQRPCIHPTGPAFSRSAGASAHIAPAVQQHITPAPQRACGPVCTHIDTPAPLTHTHVNRSTEKQYSTAHQTPPSRLIPLGGSAPALRMCVARARARPGPRSGERTDGRAARRGASGRARP